MHSPRQARLNLQRLEDRATPANLSYSNGFFNGTQSSYNLGVLFNSSNSITWSAVAGSGQTYPTQNASIGSNLIIYLPGIQPGGTPITGSAVNVDLQGNTFTGTVSITTGPGVDHVTVHNGTINGSLTINTAGDNDSIYLGDYIYDLTVTQNIFVKAGDGDDGITFSGGDFGAGASLNCAGFVNVAMGNGDNFYHLFTPFRIGKDLVLTGGDGQDDIGGIGCNTPNSAVSGNVRLSLGNGTNGAGLNPGLYVGQNFNYLGGTGRDSVGVACFVAGNLTAQLGAGNDTFAYYVGAFVGGTANVNGGPNNDTYSTLVPVTWTNVLTNFP